MSGTRATGWAVKQAITSTRATSWNVLSNAPVRDLDLRGSLAGDRYHGVSTGRSIRYAGATSPNRYAGSLA